MELIVRALTFYAWYAAAVAVVFCIVLGILFLASQFQRWLNQRQPYVLQVLKRWSDLE